MVEDTLLMYSRMADEYKRETIREWMDKCSLKSEAYVRNNWITKGLIPKKHLKTAYEICHKIFRKQWEETKQIIGIEEQTLVGE